MQIIMLNYQPPLITCIKHAFAMPLCPMKLLEGSKPLGLRAFRKDQIDFSCKQFFRFSERQRRRVITISKTVVSYIIAAATGTTLRWILEFSEMTRAQSIKSAKWGKRNMHALVHSWSTPSIIITFSCAKLRNCHLPNHGRIIPGGALRTKLLVYSFFRECGNGRSEKHELVREYGIEPVTYTHLTLPTKRIV